MRPRRRNPKGEHACELEAFYRKRNHCSACLPDIMLGGSSQVGLARADMVFHLVATLEDADHLTQEWTWSQNSKKTKEVFRFTRVR